jgi:hypothetical protein
MKKVLFIIGLMFAVCFAANAQFASGKQLPGVTTDSIKTGALVVTKYISLSGGYISTSVQVNVSKVSGTPAGSVKIYGSVDGTNYVLASTDTLAISNIALGTKIWTITNAPYSKLKVVGTGTGTMKAILDTWYLARKTITE